MEAFFVFVLTFGIVGMLLTEPGLAAMVAMMAGFLLALYLFGDVVVWCIVAIGPASLVISAIQKVVRFIKNHRPHHQV